MSLDLALSVNHWGSYEAISDVLGNWLILDIGCYSRSKIILRPDLESPSKSNLEYSFKISGGACLKFPFCAIPRSSYIGCYRDPAVIWRLYLESPWNSGLESISNMSGGAHFKLAILTIYRSACTSSSSDPMAIWRSYSESPSNSDLESSSNFPVGAFFNLATGTIYRTARSATPGPQGWIWRPDLRSPQETGPRALFAEAIGAHLIIAVPWESHLNSSKPVCTLLHPNAGTPWGTCQQTYGIICEYGAARKNYPIR